MASVGDKEVSPGTMPSMGTFLHTRNSQQVAEPNGASPFTNETINEVDIIWHNMYAPSTFSTWRKTSSRSIAELLVDFAKLVDDGIVSVISLNVSKASFVAVVGCERDWDEVKDLIFGATR
ncbi:hypothetical protein D6C90_00890 [Aureobasidium pullulans]|uniref:Uncharacterized protein n=1 Tax=Aureobasidium pullulans TaxID=5580 RepID=A0A4S9IZ39_AURPU|nr:hypothetical protein D6D08_01386 [Aureobasidium pullulans]THZ52835.1 hypothetical protein D6C90_00890 [Aureobasidium pullulans]